MDTAETTATTGGLGAEGPTAAGSFMDFLGCSSAAVPAPATALGEAAVYASLEDDFLWRCGGIDEKVKGPNGTTATEKKFKVGQLNPCITTHTTESTPITLTSARSTINPHYHPLTTVNLGALFLGSPGG